MSKKLFGTDGIRGQANTWPMTAEVAMLAGRAIVRLHQTQSNLAPTILIGKDTRISGQMLEQALTAALISEGAEVLIAGPLPTPAIAHLTQTEKCDFGIMLTASHNPFQDNGIKIFGPDGYKLSDAQELAIEALILGDSISEPTAELGYSRPLSNGRETYISFAKKLLAKEHFSGLKIVLDCAHGAAFQVGPRILSELGAEVLALNTQPNGTNINAQCGALFPEATAEVVKREQADIGICLDGDADRVIFIDEKGNTIPGDNVLALAAIHLKQQQKLHADTLVVTVMSNLGLREAMNAQGIHILTTGVGDRHVVEAMRQGDYSIGGENSGHIIFAENATTGDGIMSALQILQILKKSDQKFSTLADCFTHYPQELHALSVKEKPPIESIPELVEAIETAERQLGDEGRVLIRYSGTEKKIRVLVEAKNAGIASEQSDKLCAVIQQTIGN